MSTPPRPNQVGVGSALVAAGILSVQFGAAVAQPVILAVGALGAVALRQAWATLMLSAITRPWRRRWTKETVRRAALYAAVFVGMNLFIYGAIARLPLATAITLEYLGPLAVALITAGGRGPRIWAIPAVLGVLLIGGGLSLDDAVGVLMALGAGTCWALYILMAQRVGGSADPMQQLTLATGMAAVVLLPIAAFTVGPALWQWDTVLWAALIALLSSLICYSLDLFALQRITAAVYSIVTSLNPAAAALAGAIVLGQMLPLNELIGVGMVVLASVGVTITARRSATRDALGESPAPA